MTNEVTISRLASSTCFWVPVDLVKALLESLLDKVLSRGLVTPHKIPTTFRTASLTKLGIGS
jgi:hypothetical protein